MFTVQPAYTNQQHQSMPVDAAKPVWANANTVLQNLIANIHPSLKANIILRCDELPVVQISAVNLEKILLAALQTVTARAAQVKIFLHIHAVEEKLGFTKTNKQYTIQFHSNVLLDSTDHNVLPSAPELVQAQAELLRWQGNLTVTQFKNSGSVIRLTLPGKPY